MTTAQQAFKAPEELLPDELFQRDSSLTADADKMTRPSLSYWSDAWRRFKENKVAVISSAILLVIVLMALIQPMFSRYAYDEIDMFAINQAPTPAHVFGTDDLGRDIFTRCWMGARQPSDCGCGRSSQRNHRSSVRRHCRLFRRRGR